MIDFEFCNEKVDKEIVTIPEFEFNKTMIKQNLDSFFSNKCLTSLMLDSGDRLVLKTAQGMINCIVAGGAVLALYMGEYTKIKDWDLYFPSEEELNRAKEVFKKVGFKESDKTDWATNMYQEGYGGRKVVVQLVSQRYPKNIQDVFEKFDFSVCCMAIQGQDLYYWQQAEMDVKKKELNFNYTDQIHYCIMRIARYGEKGFKPTKDFTISFANTLSGMPKAKIKKAVKSASGSNPS